MSLAVRVGEATSGDDIVVDGAAEDDEDAITASDPAEPRGDRARLAARVATVAAIAPILIAGIRAALRGWYPVGDDTYSAVRAWDVFSSNPPRLATWSSAALFTGHQINHPGPMHFDLLAIPVRLLGHGAGTAIGMALTNALAVAVIAWLFSRRLGSPGTAVAMGFTALLCWSMGSEMLYEPWSQYAPLLPFAAFLVAAWCAASGDLVALPVMVACGSYSFQTHLSYSLLVPGLAVFAVVAVALHAVLVWRRDAETWPERRRSLWRWLAITAVTTLVLWAQPLGEELFGVGQGNITGLIRSSSAELPTPATEMSLRAYGGTLAVPPFWLPPSYGSPSFDIDTLGPPLWLAVGGLLGMTALLGVLGWRALRRGSLMAASGAGTAVVALLLGLASIVRMPVYFGYIVPSYARFLWPLGMVVWLAFAVVVHDEWRATGHRLGAVLGRRLAGRRRIPVAALGATVAVVGGLGAIPTADHGSIGPRWTVDALDAIDDDVVAAAEEAGAVVVVVETAEGSLHMGPTLFGILQEAGVPFYVDDESLVRQLGEARRYQPGKADVKLVVRAGPEAAIAPPGGRVVAQWLGDGLDDPARREDYQVMIYRVPIAD